MKKLCLTSLILLSSPLLSRAQIANNTSLVGTAVDATGLPIAGSTVTAVEENTKVKSTAITNAEGYYSIAFLVPGTYDITVEEKGFKKITKTGVVLPIDIAVRTDFSMPVGSTDVDVTVTANTPPMSTDDASLGETFATNQVQDLPVQGHNALEFAALASNVIIGSKSSYSGNPPGLDFIGAGQRETQNALSLDGVSIMNNLGNEAPARPSSDMISEVQMLSGNYSAQYGAYLGLHVNLVSKNGTNDLHGDVYDYVKNTALDARNFTDCTNLATCLSGRSLTPKAVLNYNQYGFTLGGPVYIPKLYNGHNKTFFFGSYEKLNQKQQATGTSTVLTPKMRMGDFSELHPTYDPNGNCLTNCIYHPFTTTPYTGNIISPSDLATASAAIAQKYISYIPAPNVTGITNNLTGNYPNYLYVAQTLDRVDENIGENIRLFARYHWQNLTFGNGSVVPVSAGFGPANSRNYAIGYTHILTPRLVNDFHFGFNKFVTDALNYWYANGIQGAGTSLGIPGFNYDTTDGNPGIPNVQISAASGMNIGNNGSNWFQDDRTLDGYEQISYSRGKHNIIAGLELRRLSTGREATNESLGEFVFNGSATGDSRADFVLGLANNDQTPVNNVKGVVAEWRDGFFVLDNWQVTPKLTVNYGLRYDLPTVPFSVNGEARILNASQTALIPTTSATTANAYVPTPGLKLASPTHDNIGPRLGFAYRFTEKTVIRGGAGAYYNANQLNSFTLLTSNNYPFGAYVAYNTTANNPLSFTNPTPGQAVLTPVAGVAGTYVSAVTYDPANKTQRSYQWNLDVGQELWRNAAFELQYVGSHSLHLDISDYTNLPNVASATVASNVTLNSRRPNQLFGSIRDLNNIASSQYNGLTAILRQRLSHGFSGQASYTWSHDLDMSSDSNGGGTASQPFNVSADYGNSNWDIRNRFVGVLTYELPKFNGSSLLVRETLGGWQINDILNLQSGMPFNVSLGYNSAGFDQGTERPSYVHKPSSNCNIQTYIHGNTTPCIDITAYVLPVARANANGTLNYAFGNTSRNTLHGPGFYYDNLSLFKNFPIRESMKVQFRAEGQNITNHPSAANPSSSINSLSNTSTAPNPSGFGQVTGVQSLPGELSGARVLQLSGKFIF